MSTAVAVATRVHMITDAFPPAGFIELIRHDEAGECSDHEDLTVGEIDKTEHAVNHRVTQCDKAIHGPLAHTGYDKTAELGPRETVGSFAVVCPFSERVIR